MIHCYIISLFIHHIKEQVPSTVKNIPLFNYFNNEKTNKCNLHNSNRPYFTQNPLYDMNQLNLNVFRFIDYGKHINNRFHPHPFLLIINKVLFKYNN